ncbi:MAG TPA: RNA methyltransferase, partial [Kaistiaceae bacterium]|nr:RNA methyltransferase [Kaistiaceae bacterium]
MRETVTITRLGHRGDGIAETDAGPVFVPFTLEGETVEIERAGERGQPHAILKPSPERVEPVCRHFGECGGCALQHLGEAPYRRFKRDLVVAALADRGIVADVGETVAVPPASRRRAVLSAVRGRAGLVVGFQ